MDGEEVVGVHIALGLVSVWIDGNLDVEALGKRAIEFLRAIR